MERSAFFLLLALGLAYFSGKDLITTLNFLWPLDMVHMDILVTLRGLLMALAALFFLLQSIAIAQEAPYEEEEKA